MKKFLLQLLIFTSPLIILLSLPTFVLFQSKENFYKIDKLLAGHDKYLIGYMYHENNYGYLKWSYLNSNEQKNVWALGSSRVLQFRRQMFDTNFYNAGYTISSLNDFRPFLKSIPIDKYPKYLIIGLDQWMFNAAWDALKITPSPESWKNDFTLYPKITPTYQSVYKDLFNRKYSPGALHSKAGIDKYGLNAVVNRTGFRNDGSMYYGVQIDKLNKKDKSASDYMFSSTFERIKEGNRRFEYGSSMNEKTLAELDALLSYCKNYKMQVIAFLPPFPDTVYNRMMQRNTYGYLKDIYSHVKPVFEKYQYEVYDFSSMSLCNSSDSEAIDGFHGGELTYQKILLQMLRAGSVLNQVADTVKLKNDLTKKKNNYIIYDY